MDIRVRVKGEQRKPDSPVHLPDVEELGKLIQHIEIQRQKVKRPRRKLYKKLARATFENVNSLGREVIGVVGGVGGVVVSSFHLLTFGLLRKGKSYENH